MQGAIQHLPSFNAKLNSDRLLSSPHSTLPNEQPLWRNQPPGGLTVLKFANCELWVEKRELIVGGAVQRVQPRVFELILYLIEKVDRVVTRDELLRHVWKTSYVSDSVIGRCIMKARRVLQDNDPGAPIIRTLTRAGYRFASPVVHCHTATRQFHVEDASNAVQKLAVATLPFLNLTGRGELVWVEFGLAALLNRVLQEKNEFSVAPIVDIVTALHGHTVNPSSASSAEIVARAVGAHAVVAVQVRLSDPGFALFYQLYKDLQLFGSGQLAGSDLTQLAAELGSVVSQKLGFGAAYRRASPSSPDTFTSEAFVRAMRATEEQRYQLALDYLEVCVSDAHPVEMDVAYIASLAAVDHPETDSRARPILAAAEISEDSSVQARILRSLSTYHRAQGNEAVARNLIRTALDLTRRQDDDPLTGAVLLERSEMAILDREFGLALSLEKRVLAAAGHGDQNRLIPQCLRLEGVIAHLRGDVEQALDSLRRSEALSRSPQVQNANLASTLHRVAIIHRDAGRLKDAVTAIDEAEHCARTSGMPARLALILAFQTTLHSYAGNQAEAQSACDRLKALSIRQSHTAQFLSCVTAAWLSWRSGQVAVALEQMAPARATARELRNFWLSFAIGMHAGMAIAGAQYALSRELIAEMEANRGFYEGTCLQGIAEFFRAALAHRQGDRIEAWRLLREAIEVSSIGIVRSNACLAAAWLACEDRNLQDVQGWLDEVPAWTREHPHGIVALARYRYEAGDWAGAVAHQTRYIEHWPSDEITLEQRSLLACYREAASTGQASAISRSPCLLTLRF